MHTERNFEGVLLDGADLTQLNLLLELFASAFLKLVLQLEQAVLKHLV